MQRKRRNKIIILLVLLLLVVTGCNKNNNSDAAKFKKEFESYNNTISKLEIDKNNPFVYANSDELVSIMEKDKALVLFYGNPQDKASRDMVEPLIEYASKKGLKKIYYIEMGDGDYYVDGIKVENKPSLVSIIRSELYGMVNDKDHINSVIDPVVLELNTCDIEEGC